MNNLINWSLNIANKVRQKRVGITSIHESIAPTSVSIEELTWAASNVCSRSLVRKRIMELTSDETNRVGEFAASDHSRMLPVIDLVNHMDHSTLPMLWLVILAAVAVAVLMTIISQHH